jgi:glycosyltransferase involved in cell wall biosynthesis
MDNKISVIIPAFNVGKYINKTLESLKSQTFKDFEVIVINDGSSDNTLEVINSSKSGFTQKFTVIDQKNKGVSKSRNMGIDTAQGKYICFIDGVVFNINYTYLFNRVSRRLFCYTFRKINENIFLPTLYFYKYNNL